jgi:signal transduction histidine kinase
MSIFRLAFTLCLACSCAWSAITPELQALTDESIAKCQATASTKATAEMIVEKVNAAVALIQAEGEAAFATFRGKDSEFLFAGTYIWIHRLDGTMIFHPIQPQLEGRALLALKGSKGKQIFVVMNQVVQEVAAGAWVDYWWPKPGEKTGSHKCSFVRLVKVGDQDLVVGCGTYDLSEEEIAALNPR